MELGLAWAGAETAGLWKPGCQAEARPGYSNSLMSGGYPRPQKLESMKTLRKMFKNIKNIKHIKNIKNIKLGTGCWPGLELRL